MAQYGGSEIQLALPDLDEALANLVPEVEDLLRRVCHVEPSATANNERSVAFEAPFSYPDGIGRGFVRAELFLYRSAVRLDIRVDHNRMFARANGNPSERRCFMNDYVASVTVARGAIELEPAFVRQVVSGIAAARDAVRRHNRHNRSTWDETKVAAAD